ncbi:MAG: nucleotidyltransferase family protein [Acidimicrobiia bacterium]|nr:nucleotidyltransferase family protein [Acidimicrobiia bacterium]MDH5239140.1 nucleotidyltransferase family protein [Acidimicrobiia bacterium]
MAEPIGVLAAYGIGPVSVAIAEAPLEQRSWQHLMAQAERHRLVGLLAGAVDQGALPVTDAQRAELAPQFEAHMMAAIALERSLWEVDTVLGRAEIPIRVLKGPALAHTVAIEPSHRCFGDIDLLIRSQDLDRAVAALTAAGAARPLPELAAGYDRRFAKSVTLRWHTHEIDLHRTLAAGPYGLWIDLASLWSGPATFTMAQRTFATLDPERHLVHACYHAVLGDVEPRLSSLRDIALLAGSDQLDVGAVRALATAWRGEEVVAAGLQMTAARIGHQRGELTDWARSRPSGGAEYRRLAVYRNEHRRFARQGVAILRALPSWGDRLAFARAVAWPSAEHLEARGLSRWRHLVRR